ncbi:oligosaccharide flippase family protein [Oceanobacillus sp. Castelsardo]|uniref:putative polysaccharide biosynthesis protein n=1 Tax=Oceanobacillus sp. Castelsardo TaxID=1851204 RepID=UPI000839AD66|nr:oligosaccharide flippase family protein [Oceanobacillus sp. Castelsardo]
MEENKSNRLVKGALLLTLAGLISKILSAGYRIPLQNLTGDVGFYIYQQVYPILGIAMMLSLYGFPQAISKIIIEMKKEGIKLSFTSFYIPILSILFILNGVFFVSLFLFANPIANWVNDPNLASTYKYASFTFLLVPFTALIRGVFQGNLYMKPTAYSQIGEQLIRVFLILMAATLIANQVFDIYNIGNAAVIAALAGAITAIIILFIFFFSKRPISLDSHPIPWNMYVKTLVIFGVIATVNHMILLVIQFADSLTLVSGLMDFGLTSFEAMEAKGVFDRGQPLIQIGTVLGSSFALALIPSISKERLQHEKDEFYFYIRSALLFSFYLAFAAMIGLIILLPEINILLFKDDKGTFALQILVMSLFLSSLAITASSILQGLGYIKRTAIIIFIIFIIKAAFNLWLIPLFGLTGGAIATVISLLGLLVIVLIDLERNLPELKFIKNIRWITLIKSSFYMIVFLVGTDLIIQDHVLNSRLHLFIYVIVVVMIGACIFLFTLIRGKALSEGQLSLLPKASWFIHIYKGGKHNGKN